MCNLIKNARKISKFLIARDLLHIDVDRALVKYPFSSLLALLFIFSSVITVRHQHSWRCRRNSSGLYFQQCVTQHALTRAVYFCDVYSLCKNKKKGFDCAVGCTEKGTGCKELYRRPRECYFKELRKARYFITMRPCTCLTV